MNSVRLMVPASSGCCAMDASACAIAFASPIAGAIEPIAMHRAAAAMDTIRDQAHVSIDIHSPSRSFWPRCTAAAM